MSFFTGIIVKYNNKEADMAEKQSKNNRTLDMYARLCEGKVLNKTEEAQRFGVDERSIQRDIDDIRAFLAERYVSSEGECRTVDYSRKEKGYIMRGADATMLSNSEILAVSKILLESRAFTKEEINSIIDKLILGCVPYKNMKLVSDLIANEKFHYVELHHKSKIKDILWELGTEIKACNLLEIKYQRQIRANDQITRIVQPVALLFSDYYFYLNAYIVELDEKGHYIQKYDYPAIFRLDRIISYKEIGGKFKIPYVSRFEEGEFRKRIQFMYSGDLIKLKFRYSGRSVEAILDRLPTAKVVENNPIIIEADVYGKGVVMWLMSQGDTVEILEPLQLRNEMKVILQNMLDKYLR